MVSIKRRTFLGAATATAIAATAGLARGSNQYGSEYAVVVRPAAVVGLGRGDGASLSIVWMPGKTGQELRSLKTRLVLYDLGGKVLAEKQAALAPFSGASVDYHRPAGGRRQQVFGYVFIEGLTARLAEELFAGLEVYEVASGRMNIAAAAPGLG